MLHSVELGEEEEEIQGEQERGNDPQVEAQV